MGGAAAPRGPDLTAGVSLQRLADGAPFAGRVGDEGVLLVRRGSECFAVASACSHYGGPLADGVVVGDQIRCPLHHACFSLETGEALRAPALNPIACWRVEVKDGMAYVRDKRDPPSPAPPKRGPESVVIVGAGAAGNAAAEMLRRLGYAGPVTLVGMEEGTPVDRPNLSKDYLAGTAPEEWLWLRDEAFYRDRDIARIAARVARIDPGQRQVFLANSRALPYGALLLATGATPIRLPIPGADGEHVHVLRSMGDSRRLVEAAKKASAAVVIGASFIGLEVAASLRARGVPVHVVAPETRPLERVLGTELSDLVRALHESKGVAFHLGRKPARIDAGAVTLDDGTQVNGDLVVMGVGVRPELELAQGAGCQVDKGVLVNGRLETTVAGIYAAGDLARSLDGRGGTQRIEHWVVAERMGQHAARAMLGDPAPYRDVPFFWSQHYDVTIGYVGHAETWDAVEVQGDVNAKDCAVSFRLGGRLLAVATVSRDKESLRAELELERS